jgi:hypothetical protein
MSDEMSTAALWDDNPAAIDMLGFSTVAAPILTALATPDLDPVTVGIPRALGKR